MKFSSIIKHLTKRGFATRKLWEGQAVIFFGMDNTLWRSIYFENDLLENLGGGRSSTCSFNLQEIGANDWIILPYYWDGSKDDFLPFNKKDSTLNSLRKIHKKSIDSKHKFNKKNICTNCSHSKEYVRAFNKKCL